MTHMTTLISEVGKEGQCIHKKLVSFANMRVSGPGSNGPELPPASCACAP